MTITPIDISVKTRFTAEMKATITSGHTPVTDYLDKYSLPGYMWDEIADGTDRSVHHYRAEATLYGH